MNFKDYLKVKDAAEYIGVKIETFRKWAREGKVKSARHPISKYMLFKKEDLDRLVDALLDQ